MRRLGTVVAVAVLLIAPLAGAPTDLFAGENKSKSQRDRGHDRARILRERSTDAARSRVGYGTADGPITTTDPDTYYVLSLQIERLAGMIRALRRAEARRQAAGGPVRSSAIPVRPVTEPLADVKTVYGPAGPTEKSVRLFLEYRLMVAGNPRLKIGKIADDGTRVLAQVVTVDGSLVEEYTIDKKTGVWQPVR